MAISNYGNFGNSAKLFWVRLCCVVPFVVRFGFGCSEAALCLYSEGLAWLAESGAALMPLRLLFIGMRQRQYHCLLAGSAGDL